MATEKQIAANRQNAQKSTGPRTLDGRARVAQNALRHGLRAEQSVIIGEDMAEFETFRAEYLDEMAPLGPLECRLAERLINLAWRLIRVERIETETFDKLMEIPRSRYAADAAPSLRSPAQTVIHDFSEDQVLPRLMVYETRIQSAFYRALSHLRQAQRLRCGPNGKQDKPDAIPPLERPGARRAEGSCRNSLSCTPETEPPVAAESARHTDGPQNQTPTDHATPDSGTMDSAHAAATPQDFNKQTQLQPPSANENTINPVNPVLKNNGSKTTKQTQSTPPRPPAPVIDEETLELIKYFRRHNPASQDISNFDRRVQRLLLSGRWDLLDTVSPDRFTPDQRRILAEVRRRQNIAPPPSPDPAEELAQPAAGPTDEQKNDTADAPSPFVKQWQPDPSASPGAPAPPKPSPPPKPQEKDDPDLETFLFQPYISAGHSDYTSTVYLMLKRNQWDFIRKLDLSPFNVVQRRAIQSLRAKWLSRGPRQVPEPQAHVLPPSPPPDCFPELRDFYHPSYDTREQCDYEATVVTMLNKGQWDLIHRLIDPRRLNPPQHRIARDLFARWQARCPGAKTSFNPDRWLSQSPQGVSAPDLDKQTQFGRELQSDSTAPPIPLPRAG